MANYRRGRIHDEALKVLADAFRKIKDPRVNRAFVSVTDVDVTPDLKYAKVYYSVLNGDEKEVRVQAAAALVAQMTVPVLAVADATHNEVTGSVVTLERELGRFGAEQGAVLVHETVYLRV